MSEDRRQTWHVAVPCREHESITAACPSSLPNTTAPDVHVEREDDATGNLLTIPTVRYVPLPGQGTQLPSYFVMVDRLGTGIYDSQLNSKSSSQQLNWQPFYLNSEGPITQLVQSPCFLCPVLSLFKVQCPEVLDKDLPSSAYPSRGFRPFLVPTPRSETTTLPEVPVPTSTISDALSSFYSSLSGSDGLSSSTSRLRKSAGSAFGHVKQETESTVSIEKQSSQESKGLGLQHRPKQPSREHPLRSLQLDVARAKCPVGASTQPSEFPNLPAKDGLGASRNEFFNNFLQKPPVAQEGKQLSLLKKAKSVADPIRDREIDPRVFAAHDRRTLRRHTGKGHWGIADDSLLIKLVNTYGTRRWSLIATFMSTGGLGSICRIRQRVFLEQLSTDTNRLGKQCRERWVNHLQPNIKKEDWTPEEEQLLVKAHATFGNRWSAIAKMLPGRTDNSIKNHWHAALRRKGRHGSYRPSLLKDYIERKTTTHHAKEDEPPQLIPAPSP